jgi:3-hydroxyisobutyrate dehydrogenase-like beta-hydroxyacid dehydrogenase
MSIVVAIMAQGTMGSGVGKRLHESGAEVRTLLSGRSAESAERARAAGMQPMEDERAMLEGADFFLSILPPGEAENLARRLAPALLGAAPKTDLCRLQRGQPADRRARRRDHRADRRQVCRWRHHRRPATGGL